MNNRCVRCIVVEVNPTHCPNQETGPRPSELLPWADPYIAHLVLQLQQEIRESVEKSKMKPRTCIPSRTRQLKKVPR